jgi:hypothetical protein
VACDRCNNGPLSALDRVFQNFPPVAMMRTVRGVITKQGRLPQARFGNATLTRIGPSEVLFKTNSRKAARPIPGGVQWNLRSGQRMTEAYVAQLVRWMFKAALGCTYIDRGREAAFSFDFDEVRRITLGAPFHGYLAMRRKSAPHEKVEFTHWPCDIDGTPTVWAAVDVFGVVKGAFIPIGGLTSWSFRLVGSPGTRGRAWKTSRLTAACRPAEQSQCGLLSGRIPTIRQCVPPPHPEMSLGLRCGPRMSRKQVTHLGRSVRNLTRISMEDRTEASALPPKVPSHSPNLSFRALHAREASKDVEILVRALPVTDLLGGLSW